MKEVRQHRKDFAKNIRLGRVQEALFTIKKYGIRFTTDEGATGLMMALHHGQHAIATELLKMNVSVRHTDRKGWMAIDYLMNGFYKTTIGKHQQMGTMQTLKQFWHIVKPPGITMEIFNQRIHIGGHSMLFFLLIAMRTKEAMQPNKIKVTWPGEANKKEVITGAFSMDDMETIAALIPDDILPSYRKNRSYINGILAGNEVSRKEYPGCKMVFERVKRGWYILNQNIKWVDE
jgi:hypothetical protein